jgi:hypothetical protein
VLGPALCDNTTVTGISACIANDKASTIKANHHPDDQHIDLFQVKEAHRVELITAISSSA